MKIAVIGLGLIGGSLARAFQKYTDHVVCGYDVDEAVQKAAIADGTVSATADAAYLNDADVTFVALPPVSAADYLLEHRGEFKKGSVVTDISGVKQYIHNRVYNALKEEGVCYCGSHPMAGKEVSGYRNSDADLFRGASFILTPVEHAQVRAVELLRTLCYEIGFARVTVTDPAHHDRVIAYTSQLAHVASNAYMKSDTALERFGFSAGSFEDLTRVAKLDEELWADLMILNREPLIHETDTLIANLTKYRDALSQNDRGTLRDLLKSGKERKLQDEERNRKG